jgi:hypothetical protein
MVWDGFELGPVLDAKPQGELRLAYDLSRRQPVCLRYYRWVAGPRWSPLAQPDDRSPHLARVIEERLGGSEAWTERECCFGPALDTLARQGPASPSTVAGIATQVLKGLRDLHAAGGVHGSLSPATIVFDLGSGLVRIVDLEAARLGAADRSEMEMPTPRGDIAALGRICEGLLIGERGDGRSRHRVEPHAELLAWARRLQETGDDVPLESADAAFDALRALGVEGKANVNLPGGRWARRHSQALSVMARWKVAPPSASARDRADSTAAEAPLSYGQLRSSLIAEAWWKRIGVAAAAMLVLSGALALSPRHGGVSQPSFGDEACLERARPLSEGTSAQGRIPLRLQIDTGTAVALDGCPLAASEAASDSGQSTAAYLVVPGLHELRAESNGVTVDQTVEVKPGEGTLDVRNLLEAVPPAEAGEGTADDAAITRFIDATRAALRERTTSVEDGGATPIAPLQWGMIEPQAQWLLAEDGRVFGRHGSLRNRMPDSLALALAALRAANERFVRAADVCEVKLRPTIAEELGSATSPASAETVAAAILVAGARVASGQLAEPLRVEQRGLGLLGTGESPRLNRAVDALLASPELMGCLQGLLPLASDVDEAAGRVALLLEVG